MVKQKKSSYTVLDKNSKTHGIFFNCMIILSSIIISILSYNLCESIWNLTEENRILKEEVIDQQNLIQRQIDMIEEMDNYIYYLEEIAIEADLFGYESETVK